MYWQCETFRRKMENLSLSLWAQINRDQTHYASISEWLKIGLYHQTANIVYRRVFVNLIALYIQSKCFLGLNSDDLTTFMNVVRKWRFCSLCYRFRVSDDETVSPKTHLCQSNRRLESEPVPHWMCRMSDSGGSRENRLLPETFCWVFKRSFTAIRLIMLGSALPNGEDSLRVHLRQSNIHI